MADWLGMRTLWTKVAVLLCAVSVLVGFDSYSHSLIRRPAPGAKAPYLTDSKGFFAEHYDITKQCLQDSNVDPDMIERIAAKACNTDGDNWYQDLMYRFGNPPHYEPKNHCDRAPRTENITAFYDCLGYHRHMLGDAWSYLADGNLDEVVRHLGRALHVEQDFFSHSNYVDSKMEEYRDKVQGCWTTYPSTGQGTQLDNKHRIQSDKYCMSEAEWIATTGGNLKLTGYDNSRQCTKDENCERDNPTGDKYPHRTRAKDNPHSKEGKSAYYSARFAALETCKKTVQGFKKLCLENLDCSKNYNLIFR